MEEDGDNGNNDDDGNDDDYDDDAGKKRFKEPPSPLVMSVSNLNFETVSRLNSWHVVRMRLRNLDFFFLSV